MQKRTVRWLGRILVLSIAVLATVALLRLFGRSEFQLDLGNCAPPMTWLHRANSEARVRQAVDSGFCGVEVDVNFHPAGYFVVDHDSPDTSGAPNLEAVLTSVSENDFFWWLDFKNLSRANAIAAGVELQRLAEQVAPNRIIVESQDVAGLWKLDVNRRNLFKAYWASKGWEAGAARLSLDHLRTLLSVILIDPAVVTMPFWQVGGIERFYLSTRVQMAFTVDDEEEILRLFEQEIQVILTDSPELRF